MDEALDLAPPRIVRTLAGADGRYRWEIVNTTSGRAVLRGQRGWASAEAARRQAEEVMALLLIEDTGST